MFIERMSKNHARFGLIFASIVASTVAMTQAHAEILVILPETNALANASSSIKQGLIEANKFNKNKYRFRFIEQDLTMAEIYANHVKPNTQLVIGPLGKSDVEEVVQIQPKVKTLALNRVNSYAKNVYQFALSKDEEAATLTRRMQIDGIERVVVLRDPNSLDATQSYYDEMKALWGNDLIDHSRLSSWSNIFNSTRQGFLLLGSTAWINAQKLPKKNLYTIPYAIQDQAKLPDGLTFCDVPALYTGAWPDVIAAYRNKPVEMPLQRLLAFGGDAWQLADQIITQKNDVPLIQMKGRTGDLKIMEQTITRQAQCFKYSNGQLHDIDKT